MDGMAGPYHGAKNEVKLIAARIVAVGVIKNQ
jgi:hypothetical protein